MCTVYNGIPSKQLYVKATYLVVHLISSHKATKYKLLYLLLGNSKNIIEIRQIIPTLYK